MPTIPKPHRIGVLAPDVKLEGPDTAYEREAAALIWVACIELCQRHPRLAVLDAEATPLLARDGHFAPYPAGRGAHPTDAFYAPTRRDELIWLELSLGAKGGIVRLHAIGRDGKQDSFEALGRSIGEQIHQAIGAWTQARALVAPSGSMRKPEVVTAEEILAVVRCIGPTLVEQARAWTLPSASQPEWALQVVADDPDDEAGETFAMSASAIAAAAAVTPSDERRRTLARPLLNRLPQAFRVQALRLLELALHDDLTDDLLAADPEHPQARFARFERSRDMQLLREIIASAPGWARPYEELEPGESTSELESRAAAGMAAVCRPGSLEALETSAERLADAGRIDEAIRLMERAVRTHPDDPRAGLALLAFDERADRPGAWLERATRARRDHGCPTDPSLPWYPDQIHVDLRAANALLGVGRLAEATALRASRLDGRASEWPNHTKQLARWRSDPKLAAWSYAREAAHRGDEARVLAGFDRARPETPADLAAFLDALVAMGREDDVPFAWAQLGLGLGLGRAPHASVARLAACRALTAVGEHRRALEELWTVELTDPGRDDQVALARCALVMSGTPIEVIETALGERIAIGAPTLARRMARVIADFVPAAAKSGLVARALGKVAPIEFDPTWLAHFSSETRGRRQIDELFDELGKLRKGAPSGFEIADELARGDRLVERWLDVVVGAAPTGERVPLAQAAAYTAAQAITRYLAATTTAPTTLAGALRTVAAEALALVRVHRDALGDREARALLGSLDPLLRRIDRWIGSTWLATAERSVGVDERAAGDVVGFFKEFPTVSTRILGPEEIAVLAWSIARLHRERPPGWAGKVAAQASRLALHTGTAALDEWADAVAAQLAARELETDDAIDALHTASYLGDGVTSTPTVHTARALFDAGRAPAALAVVLRASGPIRAATLREPWTRSAVEVPFDFDKALTAATAALGAGEPARAEKLARWAAAVDPASSDAQRVLGFALAQQGKLVDAFERLTRGTGELASGLLASMLVQRGKLADALAIQGYASRWYTRADDWLVYARTADDAGDPPRAARARAKAHDLDPSVEIGEVEPAARDLIYAQLEAGDHEAAASRAHDPSWRIRRVALRAARFREPNESHLAVTARARAAAFAVLAETTGTMDREALLARGFALQIREQAYFARDPVAQLGERMTPAQLVAELVARGAVAGTVVDAAIEPRFEDRVVLAGGKVSRVSDYVALLRDLAALSPLEALAQFDLDDAGYHEVSTAWAAALDADPSLMRAISAGLAKR
ncbi:MAG TPA: tetratricopeptide repeat protein [Kofleriaceae bacterium]|nr:tetratricopeptide repeat protein [Kofleriaceae bacterium]